MSRFYSVILLLCLHIQPVVNLAVWGYFLVNNEYIREVLCVNKEKPELACGGKCYLMQQLQESQQSQEQEFPQLLHSKYEFILIKRFLRLPKVTIAVLKTANFPRYMEPISSPFLLDIFHPPNKAA